ncbi:hypothetical protein HPP92_020240 [Vanilla planifolia]|uniref:Uncharacterized protein n=1 Tax=Vanilla planifolia TaxID=51239 RepID=A0A835PXR7_VANPL|nr:hypothetical protein HPP92_020240 [Vanilla planifolia]
MQSALSRMTKGTPCSVRQAAVAMPDGPAPTMIGPFTNTHLREKNPSCRWPKPWSKKLMGLLEILEQAVQQSSRVGDDDRVNRHLNRRQRHV